MTVAVESGVSLTDGKNARILHAGNIVRPQSAAVPGLGNTPTTPVDLAINSLTADRYKAQTNGLDDPTDFSEATWTKEGVTIAEDGQTLTETTATSRHRIYQSVDLVSGVTYIFSVLVQLGSGAEVPEVLLFSNDGAANVQSYFDLNSLTIGNTGNTENQTITDLGNNEVLMTVTFTAAATAAENVQFMLLETGNLSQSYTGTERSLKVKRFTFHQSRAGIEVLFTGNQAVSCVCLAAHNLGDSQGTARLFVEEGGAYVAKVTVSDIQGNSPIMFLLDEVTTSAIRVDVFETVLPELGVIKAGTELVMERPFYGGFTPGAMNRSTEVIGNMSGTGELLGRSVRRTVLRTAYQWDHLTYDWVRANLDGRNGLIQAAERDAMFIAWRPEEDGDVDYVMRAQTQPPQAMGLRDFWAFSVSGEAYSYE